YFGVASLLAASLMGPGSQGKGVAVALSGLTFANLAGVPLMTALGQVAGWRTVYLVIAGIFAATVLALRWAVPAQPVVPGRRARSEERRVGKEGTAAGARGTEKEKGRDA